MEIIQTNNKKTLPNANTVLVLGILSIVISCGIGLVLGIIGLIMSRDGKALYEQNPLEYKGWSNLNAGRIMSIIGICLNGVGIVYLILWFAFFGALFSSVVTGLQI